MTNPIAATRVNMVDVIWALGNPGEVNAHFNCLDAEGNNLTGLGGRYISSWHATDGQRKQKDRALLAFIVEKATALVDECDEWAEAGESVELKLIQLQRYRDGGQGINVQYVRPGGIFESALLFETRPNGPGGSMVTRYNQKHDVIDQDLIARVHALIETVLGVIEQQIHEVNQERKVNRRPGKWHK